MSRERGIMSREGDNYVVGPRYHYVVGTSYMWWEGDELCRGDAILYHGNEVMMSKERVTMYQERDDYV